MFVQPYNDFLLNIVEGLSLTALVFLTVLNNFWVFSDETDIANNMSFKRIGLIFMVIELVILLIPIVACFGFVLLNLARKFSSKKNSNCSKLD